MVLPKSTDARISEHHRDEDGKVTVTIAYRVRMDAELSAARAVKDWLQVCYM